MINAALLVTLKAKPGKEMDVADFLRSAQPIVEGEPGTIAWFAIQWDASTFGIFDVFENEQDRQTHLNGDVGAALTAKADELFDVAPDIAQLDVLASKLPK